MATTDRYDNLTRRHTLTRTVDGRVEGVLVTEDDAVVKSWLTKWNRVPVADTARLDPARDYYVRVTTRARPVGRIVARAHQDHHRPGQVHVRPLTRALLDLEAVDHPELVVAPLVL